MDTKKLAGIMMCFGACGVGRANEKPLTIIIFDQAGIEEQALRVAAVGAQRIFGSAGVETEWSVCKVSRDPTQHCALPPADTYLKVLVISNWAGPLKDDALGLALSVKGKGGSLCYVFADPVKGFASLNNGSPEALLASVIAHEVGHLMGLKHTWSGIMKENFERRDLLAAESGRLFFNPHDAKSLRAFVHILGDQRQR